MPDIINQFENAIARPAAESGASEALFRELNGPSGRQSSEVIAILNSMSGRNQQLPECFPSNLDLIGAESAEERLEQQLLLGLSEQGDERAAVARQEQIQELRQAGIPSDLQEMASYLYDALTIPVEGALATVSDTVFNGFGAGLNDVGQTISAVGSDVGHAAEAGANAVVGLCKDITKIF